MSETDTRVGDTSEQGRKGRAGQDEVGQGRIRSTGQGRAGQGRAGQGRAGQGSTYCYAF